MWSDDHRYHTRRLQELQDEAVALRERVGGLISELAADDFDGTEDARARLGEAGTMLAAAAGDAERAREQLPVAQIRPPIPRLP